MRLSRSGRAHADFPGRPWRAQPGRAGQPGSVHVHRRAARARRCGRTRTGSGNGSRSADQCHAGHHRPTESISTSGRGSRRSQRFLAAGGNLLWLADPGRLHGLEPIAAQLGLRFVPGTLIDPVGQAHCRQRALRDCDAGQLPLSTRRWRISTSRRCFPLAARPRDTTRRNRWAATDLIELDGEGWAETGPIEDKVSFDEGRGPAWSVRARHRLYPHAGRARAARGGGRRWRLPVEQPTSATAAT